jgi:hypothetical protein
VAVDGSRRTPDNCWLVDRVVGELGVAYRIWCEGEVAGDQGVLCDRLAARHVDVDRLVTVFVYNQVGCAPGVGFLSSAATAVR